MDDYKVSPFDDEIDKLRKALKECSAKKDWGAVDLIRKDLLGYVKKKDEWLIRHSKDSDGT